MKRAGKLLVIGLFSLLLSGCMFTTPETSLYRLPKLAGEYESLESQIDALLTNGAEYAAPTSGSNLQSVQMIDLDGDGSEEAVAFFRRASDKKPMKIYIFKADGDSYERYAVIEGVARAGEIDLLAVHPDGARVLFIDTEQALHERRFTGAVLAHEGVDGAGTQLELGMVQRLDARELLFDIKHFEQVVFFQVYHQFLFA